ncbi:MAG: hypothetical protein FJ098_00590 [Deltaproteobacteria bacterium]|nr:hypothetical protein [Deltaproteobacteria bacterium]
MKKITVTNTSKHLPLDFCLEHDVVCARTGECTCTVVRQQVPGQAKPVVVHQPKQVRLQPGETSPEIPAAARLLPQVKTAVERGLAVITDLPAEITRVSAE